MDNKKLWDSVLSEIELTTSKANFTTWFKETSIAKQEEGIVFLNVPNTFAKDWLSTKYHKTILKSLRDLGDNIRGLEYVIFKDDGKKKQSEAPKSPAINQSAELPLGELYINKEDNLNPKYTLDSFVVGPFNDLAHAAAQAVIKKPGQTYNPLFIYGDTGRGKTHLIQAIGNHIKKLMPGKKVYYVTSEKFTVDYINMVHDNKGNQFKEKYRKYDVLIMDDIQFLSNTEKTQEELFHLFNVLHENNKQIIFSSDKHPNFIPNLEDRLRSRFAAGMIVDIPAPDRESRIAILKSKANVANFALSDDIINNVAEMIDGNIRELEGVLNTIICQTQLKGKELSLNEIKGLLKNNLKPKKNISPKEIIKTIAEYYNLDEDNIYEKTRKKEIVRPRQVIMYILRTDFNVSYPSIGQKMGGRDHTTVMHSCDKIRNDLKVDNSLVREVNDIRAMF